MYNFTFVIALKGHTLTCRMGPSGFLTQTKDKKKKNLLESFPWPFFGFHS